MGMRAVPWLALGIMVALWPTRADLQQTPEEARLLRKERGRGRAARRPADIPPAGWKDIAWRTWSEFNQDRIPTVAGGVAFFGILALFPGLAAFVALYGLFADIEDARAQILALAGVAPREVVVFVGEQMIRISTQTQATLSLAFVASLMLSVWSANNGMKAFINGLNIAYDETEKRSFLQLTAQSLAFTVGGLIFLMFCVGAVVALPLMLPFLDRAMPWLALLRWPALLVITIFVLAVVYRHGPSREHARWRWVTWGSAAAAVLWLLSSVAYSWYVANLAHFDRAYGPFGAAIGAMIWLWLSVVIMLGGAELNAEIEHQTAVDSTTGAPRPLGQRGAQMADTVGAPAEVPRIPGGAWLRRILRRPPPQPPTQPGTVRP